MPFRTLSGLPCIRLLPRLSMHSPRVHTERFTINGGIEYTHTLASSFLFHHLIPRFTMANLGETRKGSNEALPGVTQHNE